MTTAPDRTPSRPEPARPAPPGPRVGHYRWVICALVFFATTVNYIERQVIGILKPTLQQNLGWSEVDYADIVFAFQLAYAIGLLITGRLIDRLGTKLGYALTLFVWSLAAMGHAAARSVVGFSVARFTLRLGEAGNVPAALKSVGGGVPRPDPYPRLSQPGQRSCVLYHLRKLVDAVDASERGRTVYNARQR